MSSLTASGVASLRADVGRTLSELYEENFVAVFRDWAAGQGVPFRVQSYGEPPATVSSFRSADLSEGEGWGWDAIPETRWAASGAYLHHQDPVVSAEVWTWVHSPSLRATPLDLVGEAHEHLLAGVNQLIGHGWPYSPKDSAVGPGWLFYAAGALDDRNPWWPAMPHLARYLQRLCWLLRQGRRVADVYLYVPARDVYARMGPHTGGTSINLWRETTRHIGPVIPRAIRTCRVRLHPVRRRRGRGDRPGSCADRGPPVRRRHPGRRPGDGWTPSGRPGERCLT